MTLAADAYVYGYPLVADLTEVARINSVGMGSLKSAPMNSFTHAANLAGPGDRFVSVNNDTLYSIATVDVSGGPQILHVPDADGAYYVIQIVDAWTNNIAYIGRRATGTREAEYLLTPPGWSGYGNGGSIPVAMSTDVVTLIGRWACDGVDDLPRVHGLEAQLTLRPEHDDNRPGDGLEQPSIVGLPEDLAFYERMRTWMADFPPSIGSRSYQERFRPLGLLAAEPCRDDGSETANALAAGYAIGRQRVEDASRAPGTSAGGWVLMPHLFDYNVDYLGIGTFDTPDWKIHDRETAYLTRALAARVGLWGNHGYEASYAQVFTDDHGERLNGAHTYTVTFPSSPPVDAFWSLTMYDVPDYYLTANPIDRYSIGDRTPGLRTADDGSITIVMSHDRPPNASNWLPAPSGDFRPIVRLYQPRRDVIDGSYELPPVVRRT